MFVHIAGLYYLEANYKKALSYIDKAILKEQDNKDIYQLKAEILLNIGRQEDEEKCYKKIRDMENKNK